MPDLIKTLMPDLENHRLPNLALGDELIYPKYDGQSILNIPASVCQLLDAPPLETDAPPLRSEILDPLGTGIRRVVLILMDALALHRLQKWMAGGDAAVWQALSKDGVFAPLTSITPSTTTAAMPTMWSGASPAQHGIGGYEQWLREYGLIANMIAHMPITYRHGQGGMEAAGFDPQEFMGVPLLSQHLKKNNITGHAHQHYSIAYSGMSKMFMQDIEINAFSTLPEVWVNIRQQLDADQEERSYHWVYWSPVDSLSHVYGPDAPHPAAEFASFSDTFEKQFINQLSPAARKDTLVILTADHGQITTNKMDDHYNLNHHPNFTRRLHMQPTGENRLPYLYIRPGQVEAVREYIERTWPNQFYILDPAHALENGLFGPGQPHPRFLERIGDLMLVSRGNAYLWWADKRNPLVGRHGGMHRQEMLVPFLAARLG